MSHYTPPRAQLLAHLHQHEIDRWDIQRDQHRAYWREWEDLHPRPRFDAMHGTKRATLDALHESFHRLHSHHVKHAHPAGYDFLHLIVEDDPFAPRLSIRGDTA